MWISDVLIALGTAMGVISGLVAEIIWYRFAVRAKIKGSIDHDDFRRTVVRKMGLLGLCAALGFALIGGGLWIGSIEASFPESIQSVADGVFYCTFCFSGGIGMWLLMLLAMTSALRSRLQRGESSEPPS